MGRSGHNAQLTICTLAQLVPTEKSGIFFKFIFLFSITVYIQFDIVLFLGVQYSGWTIVTEM